MMQSHPSHLSETETSAWVSANQGNSVSLHGLGMVYMSVMCIDWATKLLCGKHCKVPHEFK